MFWLFFDFKTNVCHNLFFCGDRGFCSNNLVLWNCKTQKCQMSTNGMIFSIRNAQRCKNYGRLIYNITQTINTNLTSKHIKHNRYTFILVNQHILFFKLSMIYYFIFSKIIHCTSLLFNIFNLAMHDDANSNAKKKRAKNTKSLNN